MQSPSLKNHNSITVLKVTQTNPQKFHNDCCLKYINALTGKDQTHQLFMESSMRFSSSAWTLLAQSVLAQSVHAVLREFSLQTGLSDRGSSTEVPGQSAAY